MSSKIAKKKPGNGSGRSNSPSQRVKSPAGSRPQTQSRVGRSGSPSQRLKSPKDKQLSDASTKSLTDHVSAAEKVLYDLR